MDKIVINDGVTSIGNNIFKGCVTVKSVEIPDSVTRIGEEAFAQCHRLTKLRLPSGLTTLSDRAFSECVNLTDINIPDSITTLGDEVLSYCGSLLNISIDENSQKYLLIDGVLFSKDKNTIILYPAGKEDDSYIIPDGVKTIRNAAFSCCNLSDVTIPEGVTAIGDYAFSDSWNLKSIQMPESVTDIGISAFAFSGLKSIVIPSGVTELKNNVFYWCGELTEAELHDGLESIGDHAFDDCRKLKSLDLPGTVTSIGEYAFYGCGSLTSINLPSRLTKLGSNAFRCCSKLTSLELPNCVTALRYYEFYNCTSLTSITIPSSVKSINNNAFFYTAITNISVDADNQNYSSEDGVLFSKDKTKLLIYPYGRKGSYTIPSYVTSIAEEAFYHNKGLTEITIPSNVTDIGQSAFRYCSALTNVIINNGLTKISYSMFDSCTNLQSVTIPSSVTQIDHSAFNDCKKLATVYFEGTQDQWNAININYGCNSYLTGAEIRFMLVNTSSVESETIELGDTINITGAAEGGTAPYKYEYFFKQASKSEWSRKNVSDTTASTTVKPGSAVPYDIKVIVTDAEGNTSEKQFRITVKAGLTNTSLVSSSVTLGSTINITGSAEGGTAPYKYTYYYKQASASGWVKKNVSDTTTTTTVKPGSAVAYNIKVVVTDAAGKTAEKVYTVQVNQAAALKNTSLVSSSVTLGSTINITGSAEGGTAPYKYTYYYKQASASGWVKKNVSDTTTSTTVKPGTATTYNIMVIVTDSTGEVDTKTYDVVVK